jgi:septal ring factor EnvC (AmiA/AmiB activator)
MLPENKVFILLILFFYSATALAPQDASEYEKRLNKIAAQINSLKSKIEKETKRESSVLSRLSKLGLQKNLLRNEISYFNTVRERTSSELSGIQKRIAELQTELDKKKDSIAKILVALYKFGNIFW